MKINSALRQEFIKDIERCKKHSTKEGSRELFEEMVAKYTLVDPSFKNNLSTCGKATPIGQAANYLPELNNIVSKLNMMLLLSDDLKMSTNPIKSKVKELLDRGKIIEVEEYHPAGNGIMFSFVSGPKYNVWMSEINTLNKRHIKEHPLYQSIDTAYFHRNNNPSACAEMIGFLEALYSDDEFWGIECQETECLNEGITKSMSNRVFIVHGHDTAAKSEMARFLEHIGLEPIILHEQADMGMTIIEKIEHYTDVDFGVVLYTECDIGRDKYKDESCNKFRARQNVVFEHGYLISKLSRNNVCALVKGDVEYPGDISGMIYINMDDAGAWKTELCKNLKAAGMTIDLAGML